MKQNTPKFRLRLNLFDGIVLILALAVAAFLLWTAFKPAAPVGEASSPATVRYTVRFQRWIEGTGTLIKSGDKLVDNIKNLELGSVVSTQVVPAQSQQLDHGSHRYVLADISGYEDVLVTVESTCTQSDEAITLGGGYALRTGAIAYIRGEGYMASGPVISIEREGQK